MQIAQEYDAICILGPTASGKSRFAVELARRFDPVAEILSADSRQVYRKMDIGTGKDLSEYGNVPYHLIDIADAGEKYNIFRYQRDFAAAYADVKKRGKTAIICGGSGLYNCATRLKRRASKGLNRYCGSSRRGAGPNCTTTPT